MFSPFYMKEEHLTLDTSILFYQWNNYKINKNIKIIGVCGLLNIKNIYAKIYLAKKFAYNKKEVSNLSVRCSSIFYLDALNLVKCSFYFSTEPSWPILK